MVRARKKPQEEPAGASIAAPKGAMDVNAICSYNVKHLREKRGWTQQYVADRLGAITGHVLPQASISAMERGFDGERRRRFDAHELYLLSVVFDVPFTYFFIPPPDPGADVLADTGAPVSDVYRRMLGEEWQLADMDDRLESVKIKNPAEADAALALIFGADKALRNWHKHFRTWRQERLDALSREYGDDLDEVVDKLGRFAEMIKALGPSGYLQSMAHKAGEETLTERQTREREEFLEALPDDERDTALLAELDALRGAKEG